MVLGKHHNWSADDVGQCKNVGLSKNIMNRFQKHKKMQLCSHLIRKLVIFGHFVQIELNLRAALMKLSVPAIYRSNEQTQEFLAVNTDG